MGRNASPWSVNLNELSFDAGILFCTAIIRFALFGDRPIAEALASWQLVVVYLLVCFAIPSYMGYVLGRYAKFTGRFTQRLILTIFSVVILTIFVFLTRIMLQLQDQNLMGFLLCSGTGLLLMGSIAGIVTMANAEDTEVVTNAFENPILSILGVTGSVILLFYLGIYKPFGITFEGGLGFLEFLAVFVGCPFAGVLFILVVGLAENAVMKAGGGEVLERMRHVLIPLFIAVSLMIFSNFAGHFLGQTSQSVGGSSLARILLFTFSGVLPFRIVLVFMPPVRITNVIIGSVVLTASFISS
ncbi:MAG TPA: hypothetical protein PKK76_13825 [Leptospiraceae bacterium]|nr:hypothetical protein [Leptospiraceae bacterium]